MLPGGSPRKLAAMPIQAVKQGQATLSAPERTIPKRRPAHGEAILKISSDAG
jgi:hypothetical protein